MVDLLASLRTGQRKALSEDQVACYDENGYVLPALQAFSVEQAKAFRKELEAVEKAERQSAHQALSHGHVKYPWLCELARSPAILDAVEDLIGPNILIWGVSVFIKEPGSNSFIAWHQDCNYWGLTPFDGIVTAWVALSHVGTESGPMEFLRGSHLKDPEPQEDTYNPDNLLSRGQEIKWSAPIEPSEVAKAAMRMGEFSLHHVKIAHASGVNRSDDRRIGVAIRYMPTCTRTERLEESAMLVRGADSFGNFTLEPLPTESSPEAKTSEQLKRSRQLKFDNTMEGYDDGMLAKKQRLAAHRNQPVHLTL